MFSWKWSNFSCQASHGCIRGEKLVSMYVWLIQSKAGKIVSVPYIETELFAIVHIVWEESRLASRMYSLASD